MVGSVLFQLTTLRMTALEAEDLAIRLRCLALEIRELEAQREKDEYNAAKAKRR